MSDEQKQGVGRRAPAFTSETAKAAGRRGGHASGRARRKKRAMREVVQAVLDAKITDDELNDALQRRGLVSGKSRATVGLAAAANMAQIATMPAPPTTAGAAVRAFEVLIKAASGEIGTPPSVLRDHDDSESGGGVVIMPAADAALMKGGEDEGDGENA